MSKYILAILTGPLLLLYIVLLLVFTDYENNILVQYLIIIPVVYLIGSIPWGFMLTKIVKGIDIRDYGSGSMGMSNVFRLQGVKIAMPVFLLDMSKGMLATFFAKIISENDPGLISIASLVAIAGHIWPIFLGFKGGKGIATGVGTASVIWPPFWIIGIGSFVVILLLTKYISLASLVGTVAVTLLGAILVFFDIKISLFDPNFQYIHLIYFVGTFILLFWAHRENLIRLINRNERKMGDSEPNTKNKNGH